MKLHEILVGGPVDRAIRLRRGYWMPHVYCIVGCERTQFYDQSDNKLPYTLSSSDILADDWIIVPPTLKNEVIRCLDALIFGYGIDKDVVRKTLERVKAELP